MVSQSTPTPCLCHGNAKYRSSNKRERERLPRGSKSILCFLLIHDVNSSIRIVGNFVTLHKSHSIFSSRGKPNNIIWGKMNELVGVGSVEHHSKGFVIPINVDANNRELVEFQVAGTSHFPELVPGSWTARQDDQCVGIRH